MMFVVALYAQQESMIVNLKSNLRNSLALNRLAEFGIA